MNKHITWLAISSYTQTAVFNNCQPYLYSINNYNIYDIQYCLFGRYFTLIDYYSDP